MSAGREETKSMALFCDFENVALGVKDAKYKQFDIKRVLERLLLKGSIVVKKAYCDWERYREFKAAMHQASFELIEIPHVRMSGKNSADIRMVVDALDLCYTKSHVDTFVIISGDSDFSPLVSKLRENNKTVIGVGVKNSTSDLLIANCDEFIYYDDLVREQPPERSSRGRAQAGRGGGRQDSQTAGRHRTAPGTRPEHPAGGRPEAAVVSRLQTAVRQEPAPGSQTSPGLLQPSPGQGEEAPGSDVLAGEAAGAAPEVAASQETSTAQEPAAAVRSTRTGGSRRSRAGASRQAQAVVAPPEASVALDALPDIVAAEGLRSATAPEAAVQSGQDLLPLTSDESVPAEVSPAQPETPSAPAKPRARSRKKAVPVVDADVVAAVEPAAGESLESALPASAAAVPADATVPSASGESPAEPPKKRAPARKGSRKAAAAVEVLAPAPSDVETPQPAEAVAVVEPEPHVDPVAHVEDVREDRALEALELVLKTIDALATERGDDEKIWGSMVKQTLKRQRPGFNETYYGFRSFNGLLEEARDRGMIELERDEKSGGYTVRSLG